MDPETMVDPQYDGNVVEMPGRHVVDLRKRILRLQDLASMPNAAEAFKDDRLANIGQRVSREYKIDKESRKAWEYRARRAMNIARQEREQRSSPWPDASNVKYPLLTTAALQFGARAYPAIVDGERVVKCAVSGADPAGMKAASADRVSEHMSYQLLNETDWESDTDTMVHQIPIVGCAFKKVYPDGQKEAGFCDELVSAFDLVVNQTAKSLRTVPRMTHLVPLYPHEIAERHRAGTMRDVDLKGEGEDGEDDQSRHMLLEQHTYMDLDDDGILEPWIVTVHEKTERVLRIKAGFDPGAIEMDVDRGRIIRIPRQDYFVKVPFIPDPEGGFYDLGFGHLLGDVNDEIDTSINQMNDAATMQNAGGGFVGGGVDLGKGKSEIRIAPGRYKTVRASGNDLKNNIVPFAHPGPSATTLSLLELMIQSGKDISGVQDIMVGDQQGQQTATTTLALIEQGMKVFTAIYKRIFRALKEEFRLIFEINKASLNAQKYMMLLDMGPEIVQDYQGQMDIRPVADPNNITDMQRLAKAQMVLEEVRNGNPHVNPFEATKRAFEAARIEKVEEVLIPPPPPDAPKEPTPEEVLAKVKVDEAQATAQIKQESAQMDLQAKAQQVMLKIEEAQADFERKQREAEANHINQLRALQLKSDELDQKWEALQIKEREMKARANAAESSGTDAD
jgi:chaperonin GroES